MLLLPGKPPGVVASFRLSPECARVVNPAATVRWSRCGEPGRLERTGDAPCFGPGEKRGPAGAAQRATL